MAPHASHCMDQGPWRSSEPSADCLKWMKIVCGLRVGTGAPWEDTVHRRCPSRELKSRQPFREEVRLRHGQCSEIRLSAESQESCVCGKLQRDGRLRSRHTNFPLISWNELESQLSILLAYNCPQGVPMILSPHPDKDRIIHSCMQAGTCRPTCVHTHIHLRSQHTEHTRLQTFKGQSAE